MEDVIFAPLVLLIGFGIHQVVLRQHHRSFEQRLLNRSFVAHVAAGIGLILVYTYYYDGGDMISYHRYGVPIAEALRYDFGEVFPEVWSLFIHGDYRLPLEPVGLGSTGTMQVVAVALLFLLGNSLYAAALVISICSYLAKVMIYRALRSEFPDDKHEQVLFALALSPTGIVWTCALLKEPVLMVFFGPAFLGLKWILDGRRVAGGAVLVGLGGFVILLIKPYVLIAFALAGGAWIFWARTLRSGGNIIVKPAYFLVAAGVVMLGFTVVSTFVPSLSPDKVAESMQAQRRLSSREEGGSNFYLEGRDAPVGEAPAEGFLSQIAIMPVALVTALFRPFIFESFSAMQFLNAIEMTWLLVLFVQMVRRNRWTDLVRRVTANPGLMFCLVFVLVLALGTGLSTANLGTLSRYRAPMMPFFLLLLIILREPEKAPAKTAPLPLLKTAQA
ncbi:MAG: hypothetical protein Q8N23_30840 [Archangium sp.]|nr:hypothetical protein [Archangium sp.]MDP3575825.1 hypothetical protein [Archangium sp.]